MWSMFKTIFGTAWTIFKVPLMIVLFIVALFFVLVVVFYLYYYCKGYRVKRGTRVQVKKHGFFRKVFVDLPKRYVLDMFEREAD